MDDNAPKENPPADFNKLDLSQLQGFSFGTQWTQEKPSAHDQRDQGGERPRRDGPGGPERRDRRTFRKPAGPGGDAPSAPPPGGGGGERQFTGDRRPRPAGGEYRGGGAGGGGEYRGGPRREGGYAPSGGGGERGRYGQGGGYGRPAQERGPYDSPYYSVTFYPEDTSFNTLVQTIRKSCRTVELFEIARTVVAKTDRFVVVVAHKPPGGSDAGYRPAPAAGAADSPAEAVPAAKPPRPVFYLSAPDGIPFESDDAAVGHVLSKHLDKFFDTAEVEVEPPKGNYQVINKCTITGELLGPPNYHRYNQIVQQHHAAKIGSRMSLEAYRSRIETIRDPEVVNQWLAKMKKTTRYTWKLNGASKATGQAAQGATAAKTDASEATETPATAAPESAPAAAETPAPDAPASETPAATTETPAAASEAPATAAPTVPTFDSLEDARLYLLTHARDKVVRTSENARFHGKVAETMPPDEIRRAIEGALERQRRFPLDTANALRGRLRREHFTIFKKGSKGVSYVCAVKRKFRVPGQTFADSIGALITFIETNPMVRASELAPKFLGIAMPVAPRPVETTPPPAADATAEAPAAAAAPAAEPAKVDVNLTIDERAKLSRLQGDLMWLVREGYVTEFIDGRLFAPPPMVEARKKEIESEEHDPENFPEAPASAETPPSADASSAAETQEAPPAEISEAPVTEGEPEAAPPTAPAPDDSIPVEPAAASPDATSSPEKRPESTEPAAGN